MLKVEERIIEGGNVCEVVLDQREAVLNLACVPFLHRHTNNDVTHYWELYPKRRS